MLNRYSIYIFVFISLTMASPIAGAYAYCSLKDPVSAIHALFPEATSHKSIVKVVGKNTRSTISKELPFTLQFNELGKHTLYIASEKNTPIGLVHSRTEQTKWGLIEVAWALNLDYSIRDFYIQRCRLPACNGSNLDFLKKTLKNKSYKNVLSLLNKNGSQLAIEIPSKSKDIPELTLSILQSALKTISVTKIVWKDDIENIKRTALINNNFPSVINFKITKNNASTVSLSEVHKKIGYDTTYIDYSTVNSYKIENSIDQTPLGHMLEAEWHVDDYIGKFYWLVSDDGTILAVQPNNAWGSIEIQNSFASLIGQKIESTSTCNNLAEVTATELFIMSGIN